MTIPKKPLLQPTIPKRKCIALIAHDGKKPALIRWASQQRRMLSKHTLVGTGTTAKLVSDSTGLAVKRLLSGPLGGDQQVGAGIATGKIHLVIFFWDPLTAQPHDPDVKALLRLAALYQVPVACDATTADFICSSRFMNTPYKRHW